MSDTEKMTIPDGAVEAALVVLRRDDLWDLSDREECLAILEAAAPQMLQAAKAEAWDEGQYAHDHYVFNRHQGVRRPENPYRPTP